jgi:hypothetical protein
VFFPLLGHIWVCGIHPLTLRTRNKRHYAPVGFPPSIELSTGGVGVGTGYGG